MTFVVDNDLGTLGATQGKTEYPWRWYYALSPYLPWLAVLSLLALKPNRDRRAWWILFPAGVGFLVTLPSRDTQSLYLSLTALWLLSYWLRGKTGGNVSLAAFCIMAATGLLDVLYEHATSGGDSVLMGSLIFTSGLWHCVLSFFIVLGFWFAGWRCRGKFTWPRFMLHILLAYVMLAILAVLVLFIALIAMQNDMLGMTFFLFFALPFSSAFVFALVFGPYLLLACYNSLYRERFEAVFVRTPTGACIMPPPIPELPPDATELPPAADEQQAAE